MFSGRKSFLSCAVILLFAESFQALVRCVESESALYSYRMYTRITWKRDPLRLSTTKSGDVFNALTND